MTPESESKITRFLVAAASFVVVVAGMRAAASILVPFLLAVFIAIVITPMFIGLQKRGIRPWIALLILIMGLVIVSVVSVVVLGRALTAFLTNLPAYQAALQRETADLVRWLQDKGVEAPEAVLLDAFNPQAAIRILGTTASALSGLLGNTFIVVLIVIFILLEAALLPSRLRSIPRLAGEPMDRLAGIIDNVRHYIGMKTITSGLTGAMIAFMLALLGVDNALLLGVVAFLLNYIPNIGSLIAGIPGVMIALIQFGLSKALITAGCYLAINTAIGNFLEPRLMGKGLGISPMIIIVTMIFWAWVLGPVGMLLAVPLTVVVKVALDSVEETRWLALLMGGGSEPRSEPTRSEPK